MKVKEYSILLHKGLSLFDDTITLLKLWNPGMTSTELSKVALESGALGRSTEYRVKDIITRIFYKRYVNDNYQPAASLKWLIERGFAILKLKQIMMVFICRSDDALNDFITEIYWPKYFSGIEFISKEDSMNFLIDAKYNGLMKGSWSDPQINRIAANLLGILEEFNMVSTQSRGKRSILPIFINESTLLYFLHELHFNNINDTSIIEQPEWQLFGLQPFEVYKEINRISYNGHFIIQGTYDFFKINWKYKSMEDFLYGIS